MARLLPLLLALLVFAVFAFLRQGARPRSDRVYRPRARPFGRGGAGGGDADWVAARADVAGLRDGYSSEALDPGRVLFRCGGCQAWYHDASVEALERENGGRCALCGSADLHRVRIA